MMHDGSPLIEVGWVIVGRIDATDREAVFKARDRLLADLCQIFATFTWRMPIVEREEWSQDFRAEPAALLDYGIAERDVNHWDFAFIVTDVDLVSYYKPYALGALSRSPFNIVTFCAVKLAINASFSRWYGVHPG